MVRWRVVVTNRVHDRAWRRALVGARQAEPWRRPGRPTRSVAVSVAGWVSVTVTVARVAGRARRCRRASARRARCSVVGRSVTLLTFTGAGRGAAVGAGGGGGTGAATNEAPAVWSAVMVSVQVGAAPAAAHAPVQPASVDLASGRAVSVTEAPCESRCRQSVTQAMPGTSLSTVPRAIGSTVTVSVAVGGGAWPEASKRVTRLLPVSATYRVPPPGVTASAAGSTTSPAP